MHTEAEKQICLLKCADLHEILSFPRMFTEQSLFILCCIIAFHFYSDLENVLKNSVTRQVPLRVNVEIDLVHRGQAIF